MTVPVVFAVVVVAIVPRDCSGFRRSLVEPRKKSVSVNIDCRLHTSGSECHPLSNNDTMDFGKWGNIGGRLVLYAISAAAAAGFKCANGRSPTQQLNCLNCLLF